MSKLSRMYLNFYLIRGTTKRQNVVFKHIEWLHQLSSLFILKIFVIIRRRLGSKEILSICINFFNQFFEFIPNNYEVKSSHLKQHIVLLCDTHVWQISGFALSWRFEKLFNGYEHHLRELLGLPRYVVRHGSRERGVRRSTRLRQV